VPWVPKGDYKRNGNRCIVTEQGDIMVRPTIMDCAFAFPGRFAPQLQ
jgi:hypothetical protein